jgi:hypothetical protein
MQLEQQFTPEQVYSAIEIVKGQGIKWRQVVVNNFGLAVYNNIYGRLRSDVPIPKSFFADLISVLPIFEKALNEAKAMPPKPKAAPAPLSESERSNLEARVSELIEKLEGVEDFKKKFDSLLLAVAAGKHEEWIARNYEESKKGDGK